MVRSPRYTTVDTPYQQGGYKPSKESYQVPNMDYHLTQRP